MADQSDLLARGREVTATLWGDLMKSAPTLPAAALAPDFFALVTQFVFGMFWSRPNLDLRSRGLYGGAARGAREKWTSSRDIWSGRSPRDRATSGEVLMQTACYAGVPTAVSALNAAADILKPRSDGKGS